MLEALGLTHGEETMYLALLDTPAVTAGELGELAGVPVAPVLAALQEKGLVLRLDGEPARYTATPPEVAVEMMIRAREQDLQRVRVDSLRLAERFHAAQENGNGNGNGPLVESVHGAEAVQQRWIQLQCLARTEICLLDCPPYLAHGNPVQQERNALGVTYRVVYDTKALAMPGRLEDIEWQMSHGEQSRVLADVPAKMLLADDLAGMISLGRPPVADRVLVIHASSLLAALRALFESVWNRAAQFPGREGTLSGDDGRLLTLLSAGFTDESIARQLGWHPRTVQRRLRRLMDKLGVRTRFQAGMHAQREGWL